MKCPICGGFDREDHFKCPECERDYICGSHYDENAMVCEGCASKPEGGMEEKREETKTSAGETPVKDEDEEKEKNSPFYFKKVVCPMCGTNTNNMVFKTKIFSERKVEIDKHVLVYGWTEPDFEEYHPPLYLFWHCSNCKYTAEKVDFESAGKDLWSNYKLLKRAFSEKLQDDKTAEKLVAWLSKGINYDQLNYPMAFKLHILGIYIQEILEQEKRDTLKLGRYYLRTGWLLRELKEKKSEELNIVNDIIKQLKKVWEDIPENEEEYLKKAAGYLDEAYLKHPAIKNIAAVIDMLLWLSGIYLKMEDQEKALSYLNNVIQEGQKQKTKIDNRLRSSDISDEEVKRLSLQSKKISMTLTKARDLVQDIKSQRLEAQKEKAKKLVKKLSNRPPEEIREILAKKGFSQRIIDSLVPGKKKKLFGLFG